MPPRSIDVVKIGADEADAVISRTVFDKLKIDCGNSSW